MSFTLKVKKHTLQKRKIIRYYFMIINPLMVITSQKTIKQINMNSTYRISLLVKCTSTEKTTKDYSEAINLNSIKENK